MLCMFSGIYIYIYTYIDLHTSLYKLFSFIPPITSGCNTELWCFLCSQPEQVVEQTVELTVIWDPMTLMWRQCSSLSQWHVYKGCNSVCVPCYESLCFVENENPNVSLDTPTQKFFDWRSPRESNFNWTIFHQGLSWQNGDIDKLIILVSSGAAFISWTKTSNRHQSHILIDNATNHSAFKIACSKCRIVVISQVLNIDITIWSTRQFRSSCYATHL